MQRIIFILLFIFISALTGAQDFIGLTDAKIISIMSAERPGMALDRSYKNNEFRYLKYVSEGGNETWLIFIGESGKCNGVRITCDSTVIEGKVLELGKLYKPAGSNRWNFHSRGNEIRVDLKNEIYFFTITYRLTDKKVGSGDNRAA